MKRVQPFIFLVALLLFSRTTIAQQSYFFPANSGTFDPKVPTPEQFLGYPIGSHYTRHDQIVAYFKELARVSDRVHLQVIGKTYEERPQIIATVTNPANYAKLEDIRKEHLTLTDPSKAILGKASPVVVLLGYSVHGNETSSGEASLMTAYYLAANQNAETTKWLEEAVILIEPSLNPDGRDRAANWHNSYKSFPPVADPADKEHNEQWPAGRTNHFFTDLNRDWLSVTQIESKNRLAFFHQWYPNVHIDFHEMGTNSTYYMEPTPAGHESPILPKASYDFNATLAKYHVEALDKIGSLYFTKESYDNLSPIYGSTYPDFFGAVGITFEQASSRGLVQESTNGLVTFPFTIRNHVTSGLSTVRGAVAEKLNLFKLQKEFFQSAIEQAKANPDKAFIFGDSRDVTLTQKLLDLVLTHHLKVYNLSGDQTIAGKKFEKGKAFIVPSSQPNYRIVHSLFEETAKLADSAFYDNTSWSVIHAYGLQYAKLTGAVALGDEVTKTTPEKGEVTGPKSNYAYLLDWSDYNASKALYYLQDKGVLVKVSFKPFTSNTTSGKQSFSYGSLVIPVASQTINADSLYRIVQQAASIAGVKFSSTGTGFSLQGIDLGSANIRSVEKPQVALLTGTGVVAGEAGEVWFLLNEQLNLPVTKLDIGGLGRVNLARYTTLVLVSGNYNTLDKASLEKIKSWVNNGGTLITFKNASEWAIKENLAKEKLFVDSAENRKGKTTRVDYVKRDETETAKRINGGIFLSDIDITNPIAFGINSRKIYFTKTGTTILLPSKDKYATVAQYGPASYISGYVSKQNIANISNSASILVSSSGAGKVILFAEDPNYRHYWHGTDRLFMNAIFFGSQISTGSNNQFGEEQ
jgi:hypothetical protein